jgi:hypothetical protein
MLKDEADANGVLGDGGGENEIGMKLLERAGEEVVWNKLRLSAERGEIGTRSVWG